MGAREAKRSWPAVSLGFVSEADDGGGGCEKKYQISNLMVRVGRLHFCVKNAAILSQYGEGWGKGQEDAPPMVGSLFSWKSLLTKRRTSEDCGCGISYRSYLGAAEAGVPFRQQLRPAEQA